MMNKRWKAKWFIDLLSLSFFSIVRCNSESQEFNSNKVNFHDLQVGVHIVKRALSYPMKLIAKNAGVNGNVVIKKVCA